MPGSNCLHLPNENRCIWSSHCSSYKTLCTSAPVSTFCIASAYTLLLLTSSLLPPENQPSHKMGKSARLFKSLKMGLPSEGKPEHDTATTENAKPESSSSSVPKGDEGRSQDLCSSKSVSDRRNETDPQSKGDTEDAKAVKAGSSSSATKEGGTSGNSKSKELSVRRKQDMLSDWERIVMQQGLRD